MDVLAPMKRLQCPRCGMIDPALDSDSHALCDRGCEEWISFDGAPTELTWRDDPVESRLDLQAIEDPEDGEAIRVGSDDEAFVWSAAHECWVPIHSDWIARELGSAIPRSYAYPAAVAYHPQSSSFQGPGGERHGSTPPTCQRCRKAVEGIVLPHPYTPVFHELCHLRQSAELLRGQLRHMIQSFERICPDQVSTRSALEDALQTIENLARGETTA
jgi:hypothetical protein